MPNHAPLDNVAHKDLRIIATRFGAQFGDNAGSCVTFPTEFGDIQREYPILFRKASDTGELMAVALLGLQPDENLFLEGDRWDAQYIPGIVARGPFLIGFRDVEENGAVRRDPVVHIDLDHPRVSHSAEGERVFLEHGGQAPYLQQVSTVLDGLNRGVAIAKNMFAAFEEHKLIEPVNVDIKITDNDQFNLRGFYTLSDEKLRALDADAVYKLHRTGFLQAAYIVIMSLNNVRRLVDRKRKRLAKAAA
jgi:hypothetical protein